jgi:hypothetical protein
LPFQRRRSGPDTADGFNPRERSQRSRTHLEAAEQRHFNPRNRSQRSRRALGAIAADPIVQFQPTRPQTAVATTSPGKPSGGGRGFSTCATAASDRDARYSRSCIIVSTRATAASDRGLLAELVAKRVVVRFNPRDRS